MALMLGGEAEFSDGENTIDIKVGDMVFVPIGSTYISKWRGEPDIEYITMHFVFDSAGGLITDGKPMLQKLCISDRDEMLRDYEFIFANLGSSDMDISLETLSVIYRVFSKTLPYLKTVDDDKIDERIKAAKEYINQNYSADIKIPELAAEVAMSPSAFYASFKRAVGMTPVEYKNTVTMKHAMRLLAEEAYSIEEISEKLGFSSSAYFRRMFKSFCGMSPREYMKQSREI
jgi:AraC-like DNA-binding protein